MKISGYLAPTHLFIKVIRKLRRARGNPRFINKSSKHLATYSANRLAFYDLDRLEKKRILYKRRTDTRFVTLVDNLIADADEALGRRPPSVTDKATLPPSGNISDYWSTAPYWWPNPNTNDGLPYVRRDGEWVPGSELYGPESDRYDRTRLQYVFDDSIALALAWKFTGDRKYVEHAAKILVRFFVDPVTRMNPHLKYAQVRMGHNDNVGSPAGIIEVMDMYYYLDAVRLLAISGAVSKRSLTIFRQWLAEYLQWLLVSPQGIKEGLAQNNHGTYYDLQVGAIAEYLGDKATLIDTVVRAETRIEHQFAADGSQPEELARNTTAHYCCFNYQAWISLAHLASRCGVDFWDYETTEGASLRKGAEWLLAHIEKKWPYKQIDSFDKDRFLVIKYMLPVGMAAPYTYSEEKEKSAYGIERKFTPYTGIMPYWNLNLQK